MALQIPDKLYFRIGEVAKLIGVEPYVLRYWETEFPEINPVKSKSKQRLYKKQDVELIHRIRDLLYNQKFTIKGAKRKIKEIKKEGKGASEARQIDIPFNAAPGMDPDAYKTIKDIVFEMTQFVKS